MLTERVYWIKRKFGMWGRSVLYRVLPNWLVRESMMYASRYIESHEEIPSIGFVTVFGRVCDDK